MNLTIKNALGIAAIAVIAVGAFVAVMVARSYSQSIEPSSFRSFSVSAEGKAVAIPDVARFTFSVITEGGEDLASLQAQNTERMNAAIAFVKEQGVADEDVRTRGFTVRPRYQNAGFRDRGPIPPPEIVGYTVTQRVEVTVRDFDTIGELLAGVVERGANEVSQLTFTVDDPTAVQNEAREEAITIAKEKAASIADASGFEVGRILSINESGTPPPIPVFRDAAEGFGGAAPTIEPGSQEVTVNLTMTFEIR